MTNEMVKKKGVTSKQGVFRTLGIDPIQNYREEKGLGDKPMGHIKRENPQYANQLRQYESDKNLYKVEDFVKKLKEYDNKERKKTDEFLHLNFNIAGNRDNINTFVFPRFTLYSMNEPDKIDQDEKIVYAVWPLEEQSVPKNKWLDALCDEILERHNTDKEIEIYLVLHGKDLYAQQTFKIEEIQKKIQNFTRSVAVFEHTIDPVAEILSKKSLTPAKVVERIECLFHWKSCLEKMSEIQSSITPDEKEFKKKLDIYNKILKLEGAKEIECKCATLDGVRVINNEVKKRLLENEQSNQNTDN